MKQLLRGKSGRKNTAQATLKQAHASYNTFGWNTSVRKTKPAQSAGEKKLENGKNTEKGK